MDFGAGISIRRIEITVLASRSLIGARVTRPQFRNENQKTKNQIKNHYHPCIHPADPPAAQAWMNVK
jgi:hypothetical protein